ncbi:MAG: alpha/beta hydrolase [Planctomycetota bacterium]|nr:MAG: alpha/beta hydrolase [Planctomycetota bacterium]
MRRLAVVVARDPRCVRGQRGCARARRVPELARVVDAGLGGARYDARSLTPARPPHVRLLRLILVLCLFVAAAVLALRWLEPRLVFVPTRGPVGTGPGERVELVTPDGVRLVAWWLPRAGSDAAVLYLHGNGGNLLGREPVLRGIAEAAHSSVLALDWRGYGESEGRPSEAGIYVDARTGWDWLAARVAPERIAIWGESLGAGAATFLARAVERPGVPRALVVQSAFTSIPDMAPRALPIPGIRWLCGIRLDNLERVGAIRCWKLFVHSRADEIVPFEMGERLFEAASEPKQSLWLDRVGHNETWNDAAFVSRLAAQLSRLP